MIRWVFACLLLSSVLSSQEKPTDTIKELSLEQCLVIALKHNISIRKLKIDTKISGLEVDVSNAVFEWKLNTASRYVDAPDEYTQTVGISKAFQTGTDISVNTGLSETKGSGSSEKSSDISFRITQQLLAGSSKLENSYPIFRSRIKDAQARNQLDESLRDVLFSVTRAFYQYIRNIETIKINNNALRQAKSFLKRVKDFKDAGRGTILDVATAEVQVASREEAVLRSETAISNSLDQLKKVLGLDIDKELLILKSVNLKVVVPQADYPFALKHALQYRPDYKNSLLAIELKERDLEIAKKNKKPNLSVTYSVSADHSADSYGSAVEYSDDPSHSLTFNFSMPLLRKRKKATFEIKKYSLEKERLSLWDKQQEIKLAVKRVLRSIEERVKQIEVQEKKVKIESKRVESFEIRLKNGLIDSLELTRAYDDLDRARTDLVNSQLNLKTLIAEYHKVIGSEPTFVIKLNSKEVGK